MVVSTSLTMSAGVLSIFLLNFVSLTGMEQPLVHHNKSEDALIIKPIKARWHSSYFDILTLEIIERIWAYSENDAETILKNMNEIQTCAPNHAMVVYLPKQKESFVILRNISRFLCGTKKMYLHDALKHKNHKIITLLINLKRINPNIELNVRDLNGFSTLHRACLYGNYDFAAMIIDSADTILETINDQKNEDKSTPLHQAVINRQSEIVTLLLSSGADPNLYDFYKRISLHHANYFFCPNKIIKELLDFGADPCKHDMFDAKPPITLDALLTNASQKFT